MDRHEEPKLAKEKMTNLGNVSDTEIMFYEEWSKRGEKIPTDVLPRYEEIKKKLFRGCYRCGNGKPVIKVDGSHGPQLQVTVKVHCDLLPPHNGPHKINGAESPAECKHVKRSEWASDRHMRTPPLKRGLAT